MWCETCPDSDVPWPDAARPGVGLVVVEEWCTEGTSHQRRAAEAAVAACGTDGPPPGMLARYWLLGEDGTAVVCYEQWHDADAYRAASPGRQGSKTRGAIGLAHHRTDTYRLYRSTAPLHTAPPVGCVATVTVTFAEAAPQRQHAWIDGVFAASGTDQPSPEAGLLAAHFHTSLDGLRVLNLAAWTTPGAHRRATTASVPELRDAARHHPGVADITVRRFVPYRGFAVRAE